MDKDKFVEVDIDTLEGEKNNFMYTSMFGKYSFLYGLSYDRLKEYILDLDSDSLKVILSDKTIKRKLLDPDNRHNFTYLAQTNSDFIIPYLLDNGGIEFLKKRDFTDKINAILTSDCSYLKELFKNNEFNNLIVENIHSLRPYLYCVDEVSAGNFISYCKDNDVDDDIYYRFITGLGVNSQQKVVENFTFNSFITKNLMLNCYDEVSNYIIVNSIKIDTLEDYSFDELYTLFSKKVTIPGKLITNSKLIDNITNIFDIKDYRFLMMHLEKNNDISDIEIKRRKYYDNVLNSYDEQTKMFDIYHQMYNNLLSLIDSGNTEYYNVEEVLKPFFKFGRKDSVNSFIYLCYKEIQSLDKEELRQFFVKESTLTITNIIIDYHFSDIYTNFLLDVKQLVEFQNKEEGSSIDFEHLRIYEKLVNLDSLSYQEKMDLHEELKKLNIQEVYYDDFRKSRNEAYQMIKDVMLTDDKLSKYLLEDKSKDLEVPIYRIEEDEFYAFVKSLPVSKNTILTFESIKTIVDGASYSLDSSSKLDTFKDPKECYNLLFTDFNIDQVLHMFPVDSFSKYKREDSKSETTRVTVLKTPNDFINSGQQYNEIILAQKNDLRHDEVNSKLENPKMAAIYCYDDYSDYDVISAKNLGIGVVVINTKSYDKKVFDNAISMHYTTFNYKAHLDGFTYVDNIDVDIMDIRRKSY